MITLSIPEPIDATQHAVLEWWRALDPGIRQVFLQSVWEMEGCETPADLEPHQHNPRYRPRELPEVAR